MVGGLEIRSTARIENLFKNLNQRLRSERNETLLALVMEETCYMGIKGVVSG